MGHHRDAALGQKRNRPGHAHAALELDRAAAGFFHHAHGGYESLLFRGFIRTERHIDDDQRMLGAAHHCLALQDHHVERDGHGTFEAVHHHAEGVADKDDVAVAIEQRRRMRVIRG